MTSEVLCPTCRAQIALADRKIHLKSDWHIYNLKRVIASLPPLSDDDFQKKQSTYLCSANASLMKSVKHHCPCCKKSFNSLRSYESHLESWQHKTNANNFSETSEHNEIDRSKTLPSKTCAESDDESSGELPSALPVGSCLFCDRSFVQVDTLDSAHRIIQHMTDSHKFNLPHVDKLADPVGLLIELGRLVGEEYACLACGRQFFGRTYGEVPPSARERRKIALAAVRAHMRDLDHNYLYCGSQDPVQIAFAIADATDDDQLEPQRLPLIARIGGELYGRFYQPVQIDKTLVLPEADEEAFEVRLPSGAVLGHRRFYQTVYRQNIARSHSLVNRTIHSSLALGQHSCCIPLSITGGQQQSRSSALVASSGGSYGLEGRVSRTDAHRQTLSRSILDKYHLDLGLRGNFVLRGHLRRQY